MPRKLTRREQRLKEIRATLRSSQEYRRWHLANGHGILNGPVRTYCEDVAFLLKELRRAEADAQASGTGGSSRCKPVSSKG